MRSNILLCFSSLSHQEQPGAESPLAPIFLTITFAFLRPVFALHGNIVLRYELVFSTLSLFELSGAAWGKVTTCKVMVS